MYTLDSIVREHLIENGDSNLNRYARFLQFGISGLREMSMDISGVPQTVIIDINSNNTANLPVDYINYTRIGIIGTNGQIRDLGINKDLLSSIVFNDCGNPMIPSSTSGPGDIVDGSVGFDSLGDNYRNGELMGRFFGIGGGVNANGYYNVKSAEGLIVLSNVAGTQILLEYISDIAKANGHFNVHPFLIEALKSYMFWKSIKMDFSKGLGEKDMAKNDFDMHKRQAIRRFSASTLNEWIQTFQTGNNASVKM